tara:strand:+ start:80 stop:574 length:495 start_codon:yes stop_codon:yes gene_type:complete
MSIKYYSAKILLFLCFFIILSNCNKKNSFIDQINLINFEKIHFINQSNQYLICPSYHCYGVALKSKAPIYNLSVSDLKKIFKEILNEQPRVELTLEKIDQVQYLQKSRIFGFPDLIDIKFLPQGEYASIAIFSRSVYGYYDFKINEKRVNGLLSNKKLKEFIVK